LKLHELKLDWNKDLKTQDLSRMGIPPMYSGQKKDYIYPPRGDEWLILEAPFPIIWKHDGNGV
jgi:hypothetical protein